MGKAMAKEKEKGKPSKRKTGKTKQKAALEKTKNEESKFVMKFCMLTFRKIAF